LLLAACGASPTAPQQADLEAKQFPPAPPGKAALYVYRSSWLAAARPLDIALVGGATAQLTPNSYIRVEGPPGPLEVGCKLGDSTATSQLQAADGQTLFIEASVAMGWWAPACEIAEVPPDQGRAAILAGRRLEPQ
jgi:hypothetical protein